MKKYRGAILAFFIMIGMMVLSSCGKAEKAADTAVEIMKNGKIVSTIVEEFGKEYYAEEELRTMIEEEIIEYNQGEGTEDIKLDELVVQDNTAISVMTYKDAETYSKFNDKILFYGTVAQAYDAGYSLDMSLTSTADDTQKLDKNAILEEGETYILLLEEPQNIKVYKNISHKSDNVTLINKKEATVTPEESQLAYILLK